MHRSLEDCLRKVFADRLPHSGLGLNIRHQVAVRPGTAVTIEERILRDGTQRLFIWKVGETTIRGQLAGKSYRLQAGSSFESHSKLFDAYMMEASSELFTQAALGEGFIRRDQFPPFSSELNLEGDPRTWNSNAAYIRRPDVFLSLVDGSPALAVFGNPDKERARAIYFNSGNQDEDLRGIERFEWGADMQGAAWNFRKFVHEKNLGRLPRELHFNINQVQRIRSTVTSVESINVRELATHRRAFLEKDTDSYPSEALDALRLLLMFR